MATGGFRTAAAGNGCQSSGSSAGRSGRSGQAGGSGNHSSTGTGSQNPGRYAGAGDISAGFTGNWQVTDNGTTARSSVGRGNSGNGDADSQVSGQRGSSAYPNASGSSGSKQSVPVGSPPAVIPPGQTSGPGQNPTPPSAAAEPTNLIVANIPEGVAGLPFAPIILPVRAGRPAAAGPSLPNGSVPGTLGGPSSPGVPLPDINRRWFRFPENLNDGISRESLEAADEEKFPLGLLGFGAVFFLGQALIDRRDLKLSRAPEHQGEDSVEFE